MKIINRFFALLLTICMLLSFSVIAEENKLQIREIIANGGMERLGKDGFASSWWHTGDGIITSSEAAHDGNYAIHAVANEMDSICQKVNGLIGGVKYTFSAWVYVVEGEPSFWTKFEIRDNGNTYLTGQPIVSYVEHKVDGTRRWKQLTYTFTTPENSDNGYFYIKFKKNTNMFLDRVSIVGPADTEQNCTFVEVPEGNPNLAVNGDLEIYSPVTGAEGWEMGGGNAEVIKDEERGGNVLRVESDGSTNPWGRMTIPVEPMVTYQFTHLTKTEDLTGSLKYKFEFYTDPSDPKAGYKEEQSHNFKATYGTWQKVGCTVTAPPIAKYVKVYYRLYGGGIAYFDDATMHKVKEPKPLYTSVSAFNYEDVETGIAAARPNTISYSIPKGSTILFELKDGETVLSSYETDAVDDTRYNFKTSLLSVLDKHYTMCITYKNADDGVIDYVEHTVVKVKRPTMLRADGTFVTKDGKEITPVIGYHIGSLDNLDECADMGFNVVQWNPEGNINSLKNALDKAQELGLYIAVLLYDNGHPAGHESNVAKTTNIINALKDHPAVFAWMVQDEAYFANPNCFPDLFASYELIHGLDPDHPVYLLETSTFFAIEVASTCDAYLSDPYVGGGRLRIVSQLVSADTKVSLALGRPHYAILQAFNYIAYNPDSNGMRHQSYQALFAGAASIGHYPINAELGNPNLWETNRYEGIKFFHEEELEDARKVFITKEYPILSLNNNNKHDVWHVLYQKNDELYMIVLNMSGTEAKEADIPLLSGGLKISEFTATPVDISGAETVIGNGSFKAKLAPEHVVKYKITTNQPVDFSLMSQPLYGDLTEYDWAKDAIERLGSLGILEGDENGNYNPQTAIKRGDFAKYLIRTLGLTGGKTTEFADVKPDSQYYKEIMTGKALGILNGVGENQFNPEATISRQDLMTICARAMQYINNLDTPEDDKTVNFSDGNVISDYARGSVSAMIWNGIIEGNSDGTINPLGNTTRAEAAVIMNRIFDYKVFVFEPNGYKA